MGSLHEEQNAVDKQLLILNPLRRPRAHAAGNRQQHQIGQQESYTVEMNA